MAGVALVNPKIPFYDALGAPLVGGTLDVYLAGTTTRSNTWQDKAQTTLNTNPIVLDARGECTLWADDALTYKFVLKNSAGVQQWAEDNISGALVSATLVNFTQAVTGAVTRTAQNKMREVIHVTDFAANGASGAAVDPTGVTDSGLGIQAAINACAAGGVVYFPPGTYTISTQLDINGKDSITLTGGGAGGPVLKWVGAADAASAMLRIRRSSYCTVEKLKFVCLQANKPGYGVRITSDGAGVTQGNTIKNCTINNVSDYGVYIGNTDNLDQSVDLNTVEGCFIDFCGNGSVSIHGANTNLTRIHRGAYTVASVCAIEVGTFARGVLIDQVMPFDATQVGLGWLYVRKKFSSQVVVRDCVMEQYYSPFLFTEDSTVADVATGSIVFENWISTCNFTTASVLASYTQHGLLHLKNCYIAGRGDLSTTTITYQTPNNAGPGKRTFLIEDTVTTNNVSILCPSTDNSAFGSETTWKGNWREQAGPGITAGRMRTVSRNDKPRFSAYLNADQLNVTGNGAVYTVPFDTIVKNEGNCFAANVFTAFHDGQFHLSTQVGLSDLTAAMTFVRVLLVTSNLTYQRSQQIDAPIAGGRWHMNLAVDVDMEANDQAYVQVEVIGGAGNTADVSGASGAPLNVVTWFSGHQVA
jgi:hypothetical protein